MFQFGAPPAMDLARAASEVLVSPRSILSLVLLYSDSRGMMNDYHSCHAKKIMTVAYDHDCYCILKI